MPCVRYLIGRIVKTYDYINRVVLTLLLDQEFEGRHQAERVPNTEVPYVRYLIGRIVKTYDYINRVVITLPLSEIGRASCRERV